MIRLVQDGPIARLTLDRPAARNALARADWDRLAGAVGEAAGAGAQVIILSGAGGAFCAGADLTEFPALRADASSRTDFRRRMRRGMDALAAAPVAVVAFVEGPCFGAGVALAMACDIRIADPDARFAITPAKMGIGYPQEDVARLVSLVGPGAASRLLFTGAPIDAATAARIGLVDGLGDWMEAEKLAQEIAACDPTSVAMLKRGINLAAAGRASDETQDGSFDELFDSPRLAEALSRRRTGALPAPKP